MLPHAALMTLVDIKFQYEAGLFVPLYRCGKTPLCPPPHTEKSTGEPVLSCNNMPITGRMSATLLTDATADNMQF
jgi:hypothetical protein